MHPVQMSKNRDGNASLERLRGKKLSQECVPFGERVLAKQISTRPTNRMNSRYKFGIWLGIRSNSAECFTGNADGVLEARKIRRLTPQSRWDKKSHQERNWSTLENARRQMDSGQTRNSSGSDPDPAIVI